ncbi:DHHA1 domain-containing protein [Sporomusa aerivorans]|uniref:alanyl-tRNA editing protein n=1 Tax=Sporomusa aerivorans TaxID=204936 RepID=UPI00352B263B
MLTARLYYANSYVKEFSARVVSAAPLPTGNYAIILDRTVFYPESGGQPADTGFLDTIPVLDVQEQSGDIVHITPSCPQQQTVSGRINWQRRFDHMQQHSGEHVLTGACRQIVKASNTGFHLGQVSSQIDLDIDVITDGQLAEIELVANTMVFNNVPFRIHMVTAEELSNFPLRKQPAKHYDSLRLIEVPDFDCCPCGGTHVNATGEIGLIKIRSWERKKNGIRLDFVCGHRALTDYQGKNEAVKDLAARLSVPPAELAAAYEKQADRLAAVSKELATARQELCCRLAQDLYAQAPETAGIKIITHTLANVLPAAVGELARQLATYEYTVALIAGVSPDNTKTHLVFAANPALTPAFNMNTALKAALPFLDGKGGGSPQLAQGGGAKPSGIPAGLTAAQKVLTGK